MNGGEEFYTFEGCEWGCSCHTPQIIEGGKRFKAMMEASQLEQQRKSAELWRRIASQKPSTCQHCGSSKTYFAWQSLSDGNETHCRSCGYWVNIGGYGFRKV